MFFSIDVKTYCSSKLYKASEWKNKPPAFGLHPKTTSFRTVVGTDQTIHGIGALLAYLLLLLGPLEGIPSHVS